MHPWLKADDHGFSKSLVAGEQILHQALVTTTVCFPNVFPAGKASELNCQSLHPREYFDRVSGVVEGD